MIKSKILNIYLLNTYLNMNKTEQCSVEKIDIKSIYNKSYMYSDQKTAFIKISFDGITKEIRVNKFGWLKNYLCSKIEDYELQKEQISDDYINDEIYAILNESGEIECFGKYLDSPRIINILNNYQNGSEQSKITP